ncbi:hypothetical protein ROT00_16325 [Agromyces mediolanus]|uniref:hypothetical protein n=1 Tax=Agromyces mediolanus TaxID=41986 RepID=UPI00383749E1
MSGALFHAGNRTAPRTAGRRIVWMVVTLVPLGALATVFTVAAVSAWADGGPPPRELGEAVQFTVIAAISGLFFLITAIGGVVRVREQLREERAQREQRAPGTTQHG